MRGLVSFDVLMRGDYRRASRRADDPGLGLVPQVLKILNGGIAVLALCFWDRR